MAKLEIGNATAVLRRDNKYEGEGDNRRVVGVDHYNLTLKGDGDVISARLTPEAFEECFGQLIQHRAADLLATMRDDMTKTHDALVLATQTAHKDFNRSVRGWQGRLGIGLGEKAAPEESR